MKCQLFVGLGAVALMMQSCFTASLITAISTPTPVPAPTTVVVEKPVQTVVVQQPVTTVHTHNTTTVVTTPPAVNMAMYLDLQAVAAAFAQSSNVRQFEQILNSPNYMINNLDLNHDGYIDYLRVLETLNGREHRFVIQACVAYNTYTDVATITTNGYDYVRVTGATPIYGANYYVQPTFVHTPAIYSCFQTTHYTCWTSPYYYNNYPSYYTKPKPYELSHYQAYVQTYVSNNRYITRPATTTTTTTTTTRPASTGSAAAAATSNTRTPVTSSNSQTQTNYVPSRTTTTTTNVRSDGRVNTRVETVTQHNNGTKTVEQSRTTSTSRGASTTTRTTQSTTNQRAATTTSTNTRAQSTSTSTNARSQSTGTTNTRTTQSGTGSSHR